MCVYALIMPSLIVRRVIALNIMSKSHFIVSAFLALMLLSTAYAEPRLDIVYRDANSPLESAIKEDLQSSELVTAVVEILNEEFVFLDSIKLVFGDEDGPLFDPQSNKISVPYTFVDDVRSRFASDNYSETDIDEKTASMDVLAHTLIHEFAHAFIFMHEIPVLGREEDAADALATVLLVEYFDNGQDIAISAADLFDLESEDRIELEAADFWGEHSLDSQRFYSTLCHVYGSDPVEFTGLPESLGFSEERAELCIEEFRSITSSWFALLQPYRKQSKQ